MRATVAVVVPRRPSRVGAVDSQLMAAAHLSRGFAQMLGEENVLLLGEGGPLEASDMLRGAVHGGTVTASSGGRLRHLPRAGRVLVGDLQAIGRRQRLRDLRVETRLGLVVQYHHRFQDVGLRLGSEHGCPVVLRVEALEVEEQRAWGLRSRRGGRVVASLGEDRLFRRATMVAPVSAPLGRALERHGVPPERILVTPNGIDLDLFRPDPPGEPPDVAAHGLDGRFLVGWVGGFRAYHGLDQVESIVTRLEQRLPEATLCLLGTGPLRADLTTVAERHPLALRLLPEVAQDQIPGWLSRFDVCLQMGAPGTGEHYSPLKVLEYLACGRPVVAPDLVTSSLLTHGVDSHLYAGGDVDALVSAVATVHDNAEYRASIAAAGRRTAQRRGSWSDVAQRMLEATSVVTA